MRFQSSELKNMLERLLRILRRILQYLFLEMMLLLKYLIMIKEPMELFSFFLKIPQIHLRSAIHNISVNCCILMLQVTPNIGINEASFMIRVKDAAKLDYEKVRLFNLSLVAREVVENGRESRVAVTIHVRDQNDNRPMFSLSKYEVWIKEDLSRGHGIINIAAKDLDSGVYGTPGIM